MSEKISTSMENLSQIMRHDPDYAWGWLCNIAVASQDEGMERAASNRAAARFMKNAFGIDMTEHEFFEETQQDFHQTDPVYQEAVSLAVWIWRKFYKEEAPDWKPLDTTLGVLSQIDNMVAGI